MDPSDFLSAVAKLCNTSAQANLDKLLALGPKPLSSAAAALWEQQDTRLRGQIESLTALAPKLAAASVIDGLQQLDGDMDSLTQSTKDAEQRIAHIAAVSAQLSEVGRVLDLGLAILTMAAAPSLSNAEAVLSAADKLKGDDEKNDGS